jgi:phospholipase/carboxylesterase
MVEPHTRLSARPGAPGDDLEPGVHPLGFGEGDGGRDGLIYVPDADGARPLLLTLHGATMHARQMLRPLLAVADEFGVVLVVPDSRGQTWDVLLGGYGPDVDFMDRALDLAFTRCNIAPDGVAIGGVSDGASYALSIGVGNGDLFPRIVAFSPGFIMPLEVVGTPSVFVSHGIHDRILPIDQCGRSIVAGLRAADYDVEYVEFDGGHEMPDAVIRSAFGWLTGAARDGRGR